MGRIFWVIAAICLGATIHLSYLLFAPNLAFQKKLAAISHGQHDNSFEVLDPAVQGSLVEGASPADVVGLCQLNLGSGKLLLNADLPATYWTLTVYNSAGQQVYALTDAQSGAQQFTVDFTMAKSVFQQLFSKGDSEDALVGDNLGWHAEIAGQRGLVVIWIPVADPLLRPGVADLVKKTKCVAAGS